MRSTLAFASPWRLGLAVIMMLREWYMHPNGQIPAYEWAFGDVNPPVHAWAAWRVYKIDKRVNGVADRRFLERVFQKLLLNFTWWVNRKDADGHNVFQGGFLGLDNIGVFDRSAPLPTGGHLGQADGTAVGRANSSHTGEPLPTDWPTPSKGGDRGRGSTNSMRDPGATRSTTAAACCRR